MATVTARKRGKVWEYRFDAPSTDGRRRQVSKSGFRTRKLALEAGLEAERTASMRADGMTVREYLRRWLEYREPLMARNSLASYKNVAATLSAVLGDVQLASLTAFQLQGWLNGKRLKHKSYIHNLSVIRTALKDAVEVFGYIGSNPADKVRVPRRKEGPRACDQVVSRERFAEVLAEAPGCYRTAMLLGWHCGLRESEALGLTWDRVDMKSRVLRVNRQIRGRGDGFDPAKSAASVREITFSETLGAELEAEKARQEGCANALGRQYKRIWLEGDDFTEKRGQEEVMLVCRRDDGRAVLKNGYEHWLGTRGLRSHQLRHTHATMLLEAGANYLAVSKRLGHSNVGVTMSVYAHATEGMEERMNGLLERLDV